MTKIYQQHDAAFNRVSAYAITKDGRHIGNINLKYPQDGAGRVYAYIHCFGYEMQRDYASGYGYDKRDSAIKSAMRKVRAVIMAGEARNDNNENAFLFAFAMNSAGSIGSGDWDQAFEKQGFQIWRAI